MKAKLLITALVSLISASSAFADIRVIKSQIEGQGYEINGVVNIIDPTISIDGENYYLYDHKITAQDACKAIGLEYHSFQSQGRGSRTVAILNNGSIEMTTSSISIKILSCKAK